MLFNLSKRASAAADSPDGASPSPADISHHGLPYRADIDGLRALAVLPIIFNHVGMRGFAGGFVGVDIFFVISGYLITAIMARDMQAGRHSIALFYRRRILRILPALFAMLLLVTPLAVLTLLPGEVVRFARSLAATAAFASNVGFYLESGYFDASSHVKPLLHTWSLAIEEQFYILWPLLLAWSLPGGRTRALVAVGAVALLSFAIAALLIRQDMNAAFYLLPARAWELALGGMLALLPAIRLNRSLAESLSLLALGLIGYATWRFSPTMPFPGPAALVPCAGAALLILTGPATLVGRALSLAPTIFIGRISYSLYLWHWPVAVFAQTWLLLEMTLPTQIGVVAMTFVLATTSWRFVETPFRAGGGLSDRRVFAAAAGAIAAALALAAVLIVARGIPDRLTPGQQAIAGWKNRDVERDYRRGQCFIVEPNDRLDPACLHFSGERPAVLLIGDSMSAHLWPGLSGYSGRIDILQASMAGCTPGVYPGGTAPCNRFFRPLLTQWVRHNRPAAVILAGRWRDFDLPPLEETLAALKAQGVPTLLVGPPPTYTADLPRLLIRAEAADDPRLPARWLEREAFGIDSAMRVLADRHSAAYVSLTGALCAEGRCRTLAAPQMPMQFDYGHLTPAGSRIAAEPIMAELDRLLAAEE